MMLIILWLLNVFMLFTGMFKGYSLFLAVIPLIFLFKWGKEMLVVFNKDALERYVTAHAKFNDSYQEFVKFASRDWALHMLQGITFLIHLLNFIALGFAINGIINLPIVANFIGGL